MSEDGKQKNSDAMQYDTVLCTVHSKEIQDYSDLMKYTEHQMFKMCGIPKKTLGVDKLNPKSKWWQFWKWHCA